MKIPRPLAQELRALRLQLGLSQSAVEQAAGLSPHRLSSLEGGRRTPRPEELARLCQFLGVSIKDVAAWTDWTGGRRPGTGDRVGRRLRDLFGRREPFQWKGEVTFEACLAGAFREFSSTMRALATRIDRRPDRKRLGAHLRTFPCGARGEALFVQHLLARNWRPTRVSPLELGFADPRLRDFRDRPSRPYVGHRPMPALARVEGDLASVVIPQIPLDGEKPAVLDFLLLVREGRSVARGDLEIDGPGHDVLNDEPRRRALGLPTLRFRDEELDREDLPLEEALNAFCRTHGRPWTRVLRPAPPR